MKTLKEKIDELEKLIEETTKAIEKTEQAVEIDTEFLRKNIKRQDMTMDEQRKLANVVEINAFRCGTLLPQHRKKLERYQQKLEKLKAKQNAKSGNDSQPEM